MKLSFRQIDPFVNNPDPAARVILVYGPDQGLMVERATKIAKLHVADLNDPFNAVTLTMASIKDSSDAFFNEAYAQSLMGGNRLIMIKDGADALTPVIKDYLEKPADDMLVVIYGGDLGPRSSLRKLAESAKNAAALPCYVDDERNMGQIIRDSLHHAGYQIDRDAAQLLTTTLIGDRAVAKGEIEKLILFKGWPQGYKGDSGDPIREKTGMITMADVQACIGNTRDWSMDSFIYAVGNGQKAEALKIFTVLMQEQTPVIVLLRALQNHFWKLYSTQAKITDGMSPQAAMDSLTPPLFFKVKDAFAGQLRRWPLKRLERALDALGRAEVLCKKTGYDDVALLRQSIMTLA